MTPLDPPAPDPSLRILEIGEDQAGGRLDRALADQLGEMSRVTIQRLMAEGQVTRSGVAQRDPSAKAASGVYHLIIPPPQAALPLPEDIALDVLFEDQHLIVIDKPAGLAAHPAPGSPTGTLVNALLRHCGISLSGIGGVARPGIVHRLDKLTSGVMVAAKTDAAHLGLSKLFAAHDIERSYIALTRGAPKARKGRIESQIGRSSADRQKMAVLRSGGRLAITDYAVEALFGPAERPLAARVRCRLETGRTHQIRVHLASQGAPVLGDPVYGAGQPASVVREAIKAAGLQRQALHASVLGFVHPVTGQALRFETQPPADMQQLQALLKALGLMRAVLLGLIAVLALGGQALAKPAVWVVHDADSTLVLFGSVHLLPPKLDWRPPALDAALAKADDLWFEIPSDPASQSEVNEAIMAKGLLPPGQTLTSLLPKTTADRLTKAAATLDLSMDSLQRMKPWLADASISIAALRRDNVGTEDGVEAAVSAMAPAGAKRQAFETGPGQIDIFDAMPLKDQVASLNDTLDQLTSDPHAYDDLLAAWMKGDVKALQKLGPDEVKKTSPGMYKALITDRNAAWLKLIRQRLAGSGETVVVVGAGHLVGRDGLPAQLRALGYKVDGP